MRSADQQPKHNISRKLGYIVMLKLFVSLIICFQTRKIVVEEPFHEARQEVSPRRHIKSPHFTTITINDYSMRCRLPQDSHVFVSSCNICRYTPKDRQETPFDPIYFSASFYVNQDIFSILDSQNGISNELYILFPFIFVSIVLQFLSLIL